MRMTKTLREIADECQEQLNEIHRSGRVEHTPVTEQVRVTYVFGKAVSGLPKPGESEGEFDRWFQEEIRKAKEEAWEEGLDKGFDVAAEAYRYGSTDASGDNPYRKEQSD